jgi:type IV secretory pathway TrbL component
MRGKFWREAVLAIGLASVGVGAAGCAAAAAAGAAGAIYATTRGVESLVASPIERVVGDAESVMKNMGIVQDATSSDNGGAKRELKGKHGDLDVTVQLEQQDSATTKVEVSARKNLAEWDKDYARSVLDRIIHAAK